MASEPKTIEVEPGSEIDRLLDEAAERPLRLVRNGERFRIDREIDVDRGDPATEESGAEDRPTSQVKVADPNDIWAGYDPERARAGILAAAGSWRDIDAEAFKAYIRERRRTKNRPPVRW